MNKHSAPRVGLEPTTPRLTAECSAIELLRNMESGDDLSSRAVTSQVLSALRSLTSVFGMGTGGTFSPLSPEIFEYVSYPQNYTGSDVFTPFGSDQEPDFRNQTFVIESALQIPQTFSDQALDLLVLATFHITAFTAPTYQPCRLQGVLLTYVMGYLFLRGASRLDAFSVYPVRTSLPCYAVGTTTVAPEVRPLRSSRTRSSSSHVSYAHDG